MISLTLARPLDTLVAFDTASQGQNSARTARYAIRQALDQEYQKYLIRKNADARQARYKAGSLSDISQGLDSEEPLKNSNKGDASGAPKRKRDFFGRIIDDTRPGSSEGRASAKRQTTRDGRQEEGMVWVSFHEGSSTAVRKPITLDEFMRGL